MPPPPASTWAVTNKCVTTAGLDFISTKVEQEPATVCHKEMVVVSSLPSGPARTKAEIDLRSKPTNKDRYFAKAPLQAARHVEEDPAAALEPISAQRTASGALNNIESEVVRLVNLLRSDPAGFAEMYITPKKDKLTGTLLRTKNTWVKTVEGRAAIDEAEAFLQDLAANGGIKPILDGGPKKKWSEDGEQEDMSLTGGDSALVRSVQDLEANSRGLILAARDLVCDIGPKGLITHRGTDESTLESRLFRYVEPKVGVAVDCSASSTDDNTKVSLPTGEPPQCQIPELQVAHELLSFGVSDPAEIVSQLVVDDGVATRHDRAFLVDPRVRKIGVAFTNHRAHGHCCSIILVDNYTDKADIARSVDLHNQAMVGVSLDTVTKVVLPQTGEEVVLSKEIDAKGNGICAACYGEVPERLSVFGHGGQRFHRHCLVCRVCKSSLQVSYYVHIQEGSGEQERDIGSVYCADCMRFRFPPRCFKCHLKMGHESHLRRSTTVEKSDVNGRSGEGRGLLPHCEDCFAKATILVEPSCDLPEHKVEK